MSRRYERLLKRTLDGVPPGFFVDTAWLTQHGLSRQLAYKYVRQGWLEHVGRGLFRRPFMQTAAPDSATGDWMIPLLSAQWVMGYDLRLGGPTALSLSGQRHYLPLGGDEVVYLYANQMPGWFTTLPLHSKLRIRTKGFTLEIDIDRPVAEVFAFLAETENTPRWYEAVQEVRRLTPGPIRAGSVYRMTRVLPQGRVVNQVEVRELEPDHRVTLESRSGPTPFSYRYSLAPTPRGTRLTLDGSISGEGMVGPAALLAPLAPMLFKRGMADNLRALRRLLETSGGHPSQT